MFQNYISRRRKFSLLSFIIALVVLLCFSFLSFRQITSLQKSEQLVTQSYQVKVLLEQLISCTRDAEINQLTYSVTKDSTFQKPYNIIRTKLDTIFSQLKLLTIDNPTQQKNIAEIQPIVNHRLDILYNDTTSNTSNLKSKVTSGKIVMDELQQKINNIITEADRLLQERKNAHKNELTITPYFALLLLIFSVLKFFTAFYVINNDFKKINKVTNELKLINDSFEHAEEIAKISHWQLNLEDNKLTYSDNQYLLLGCQPGEFPPTIAAYLNFVHPDDRAMIVEGGNKMTTQSTTSDVVFRVIRKDGALRYFKSTGRILEDNNGKKFAIGINYDITEQYIISKELEEKNTELTNRNIELASFNYIASHDLQEPLRKIQLFISKIFDDNELKLSEKNIDYFTRMQNAANRMQNLIGDLLTYSKTNEGYKVFEATNINAIVENIKEELYADETIAEKNITINFKDLPTINGIPFQVKQLFANLIDNSIKYSKPMRPLIITIESSIVNGTSIKDIPNANEEKKYFNIAVADNGIGFEQSYSKQIFTLFQRLHDKKSYTGTGIGLAICKKVVENHNGYIAATGEMNVGSTFNIYFPV